MTRRVAVLISGRGSNLEVLLRERSSMDCTFVGVVSSRADAPGLRIAESHGVPTFVLTRADHPDRDAWDDALEGVLARIGADFLVLAGFMRILGEPFVRRWQGRLVNIHPSLLPAFPGLHPHRQALDAGVRYTGCTVHFVAPGAVDGGAILDQAVVPVADSDDVESLAARVLAAEHTLYPRTLRRFFAGELVLCADGRVRSARCAAAMGHSGRPALPRT